MAHTRTWSEVVPANSEAASQGASRIRNFRVDVRERMAIDHVWNDGVNTDGFHTKVTLPELAADPTQAVDTGIVYTKESSDGNTELFYIDEGGVITQLTSAGVAINPIVLAALAADPGATANQGKIYVKDFDPGSGAKPEMFFIDEDGSIVQLTLGGSPWVITTDNVWTGGQATTEVALTDAAGIDIDASLSNAFRVTLAGNRALNVPTNGKNGQVVTLRVIQDAGGSRTLTPDAAYNKPNGLDLTLSTAAGAEDLLTLYFVNSVWRILSITREITSAV